MEEPFLSDTYFGDVGRVADAALSNRNRFIEWAYGIVTAILFGVLVARSASIYISWLASGFMAAIVMPLFSIAVIQHGYFIRYNQIRKTVIRFQIEIGESEKQQLHQYLSVLVRDCDLQGKNNRKRAHLIWSVFLLGFGYLIVAANAAFVWLSIDALSSLRASLQGCQGVLVGIAVIVAVYGVIAREVYFLARTHLLDYVGFRNYEDWKTTAAKQVREPSRV